MQRKYSRIPKDVGQRIKNFRERKNLTQARMAEMIGVSETYVGFIEQGVRNPSISTLDKIARVLGVKLSDLFS